MLVRCKKVSLIALNNHVMFDKYFHSQISALSKSCYYHIRDICCLPPYLDLKTASTIATTLIHSKLHYCNLLWYNLPQSQIKQDGQLSQRDRAAACVIILAKSGRLELGNNILRTL